MSWRGRHLTREERDLWALVARATVPLKGRVAPAQEANASVLAPLRSQAPLRRPAPASTPPAPVPRPPLVPLERRTARQLARGQTAAGAVMDLHGMTQAEAHAALIRFLFRAQAQGQSLVLIVTGKGAGPESEPNWGVVGRGVLRRIVPHWLTLPGLRPLVLGFEEAGPRQGGGGALYVRLRRRRA